jgi:hypothetical protein
MTTAVESLCKEAQGDTLTGRERRLLALLAEIDAHPRVRLPDGLAQRVAEEIAEVAE